METAEPVQSVQSPAQSSARDGLLKAFAIGVMTPVMTMACAVVRKDKPAWLMRESVYTPSRPIRNLCFAFGMVSGMGGMLGIMYQPTLWALNEFLAPTTRSDVSPHDKKPHDVRQLPETQNEPRLKPPILT